jgi:glycosyltransferase involved in cell wall biosynthesis
MVYAQRIRHTFDRDLDALIALNLFEKDKLVEGGLPEEKIFIKPNFCPDPLLTTPDPRPAGKTFTLCFAGRLSVDKGIPDLLAAWADFCTTLNSQEKQNACLQIAGGGDLLDVVCEAARQDDTIEYLGCLKHDETLAMIAHANCLVCPSIWYEGMPMTILEAYSTGTPVIASRIGGLPDMVEESANGFLFPPGDRKALATLIRKLHSDPARLYKMGSSARNIYSARFSEQVNFPILEGIYRDTIERFNQSC